MPELQQLHVAETEQTASGTHVRDVPSFYEQGAEFDVAEFHDSYSFPRFVTAVLNELGKDYDATDARLVDALDEPEDVHFGFLAAFPDESLLFVGSDPTAKDSIPWFAFVIERHQPIPAPESAQDALDLLKPRDVKDIEQDDDWLAPRHGEWWLLPCSLVPAGSVFTPGVSSRPYGPSPLGNHVPREYAFTTPDGEFMDAFEDATDAPASIQTPPEAIEWIAQQIRRPHADSPIWADVREWAGEVLVRGTIRHRDNDHFVENVGETWHKAQTHDIEVYTGDEMATNIHLDYYGQ